MFPSTHCSCRAWALQVLVPVHIRYLLIVVIYFLFNPLGAPLGAYMYEHGNISQYLVLKLGSNNTLHGSGIAIQNLSRQKSDGRGRCGVIPWLRSLRPPRRHVRQIRVRADGPPRTRIRTCTRRLHTLLCCHAFASGCVDVFRSRWWTRYS